MLIYDNICVSIPRSGKGDCIRIRFIGQSGIPRNIIIDTGPTARSGEFRKLYNSIISMGEKIDALFITHYDDDHIGGILKLVGTISKPQVENLYFNSFTMGGTLSSNLSAVQNQRLFHQMMSCDTVIHSSVLRGQVISIDGAAITIISPEEKKCAGALMEMERAEQAFYPLSGHSDWCRSIEELMTAKYPAQDVSVSNQASLVMVFEYLGRRFLFTGDAPAKCIEEALQVIDNHRFDMVKLPHHGSIRNLSDELLGLLNADVFLICADGTTHPDKQTIAKLMKHFKKVKIYSNYSWWLDEFLKKEDYKYINDGSLSMMNINTKDY